MAKTCYMCDAPSTSKEHAPPQCLFPESKDLKDGKDYRRNLITVPSCDLHNSAKSEDDTYLMMVLVSYFQNNEAAQNHIATKVLRAWTSDQKLAGRVVKNLQEVEIAGEAQHAFEVDMERFDRSLELAAHGIHSHHFKAKAPNPYRAISYPLAQFEGEHANSVNQGRAHILSLANTMLEGLPRQGFNPEIFWYQVSPLVDGRHVMRMCFYQAFVVVLLSSPDLGT